MKAVKLGDLRNLDKNPELKNQFNGFMAQKFEELGDDEASKYFNTNPEFRRVLKFIRKGALDVADVLNFFDVKSSIDSDGEFSGFPGQHLNNFVDQMSRYVKIGEKIEGNFNGINLSASRLGKETNDKLLNDWHNESKRRQEEWEKSPEYKKQQKEFEAQRKESEILGKELVGGLNSLDFLNVENVLDWMNNFSKSGYDIPVGKRLEIVYIFKQKGFFMDVNIGSDFNENDPDNYARYIIGQGLSGILKYGSPHQILPNFVARWKNKFTPTEKVID